MDELERLRAENQTLIAGQAALVDSVAAIPRRRRAINETLRTVAVDPRADAYAQACQDIEVEIRTALSHADDRALDLLAELDRLRKATGDA